MNGRSVFIDGRFYAQPLAGVQRYGREIVRAIDAMEEADRFTLLLPQGAAAPALARLPVRTIGRGRGHVWSQGDFAWAARRGVALSLGASGALLHPRHLVVIHDAAVFRHPEHYSRAYAVAHRTMGRVLARTARIATVSEFSRAELAAVLGIRPEAITVAPNGADHLGSPGDESVIDRLELRGRRFFLILGSLSRNKNLAVALRALARLPDGAALLVAVGGIDRAVFGTALPPAAPGLLLAGRLEDGEVAALMRHARALLFPSLYEGFGLPPLEAMARGCPVLASTAGAVREVCGDAADYFDPQDDAALAGLMLSALEEDRRAERVHAARVRVARYRWADSARILADRCLAMVAA